MKGWTKVKTSSNKMKSLIILIKNRGMMISIRKANQVNSNSMKNPNKIYWQTRTKRIKTKNQIVIRTNSTAKTFKIM